MSPMMRTAAALAIGVAATVALDLWNLFLARVFGIRSLDFCLLGRWVSHLPRGVVHHASIASAEPHPRECIVGWVAHYGIGVSLAVAFTAWVSPGWLQHPTLGVAVLYGVATVVFPFALLQPALGLGFASAATRHPWRARLKSLATHTMYGVGLYAGGRVALWMAGR